MAKDVDKCGYEDLIVSPKTCILLSQSSCNHEQGIDKGNNERVTALSCSEEIECSLGNLDSSMSLTSQCSQGNLDSSTSLVSLCSRLDELMNQRAAPWSTKLILPNIFPDVTNANSELLSSITADASCIDLASQGYYDIIPCLERKFRHTSPLFYFDKNRYPVTDGFLSSSWPELRSSILSASSKCGSNLFSNEKYRINYHTDNVMFCCTRRRQYSSKKLEKKAKDGYRSSSFQNDRMNSRGIEGKCMSRRTCTTKSLYAHKTCPFFLLFVTTTMVFSY